MEFYAAIFMCIYVLTAITVAIILAYKKKVNRSLIEVEATLVDIDTEHVPIYRGNKKLGASGFFGVPSYSPVYEYEYNGEVYIAACGKRMSTFSGRYKIGEKAIILISADNPSSIYNIKQTKKDLWLDLLYNVPLLFCVLVQLVILIAVFATFFKCIIY